MNPVVKLDHQDIAESSTLRYDIAMEDERIAKVWLQTRSIEMDAFRKCPVIVEGDAVVNVVDPEDNEYLVNLACATTEKITETLSSARKFAFRLNPFPDDRRKCWNRIVKLLEDNVHLLSVLESKSTGRAFRRVKDNSLPKAIEHMQKFASYSELLFDGRNRGSWSPQGVVLASLPSTSELELLTLKLAPILASGNAAVVCLEPVVTSGSAQCYVNLALLLFAELCTEAGFGDGSLHVAVCQWPLWGMAINDNVDSVVFIGSLEKARLVQAKSAEIVPRPPDVTVTIRRQLVVVVFESADLDSAVEGVVNAMCRVDGSVATQQQPSVNFRLFVQESVFPRVRDKLRLRLQKLRAGKSLDRNSDYVDTGECLVRSLLTALVHGDQDCLQFREARGEVLAFRTVKEAVSMANGTGVSSAAHLWTENMTMAMEASRLVAADFVLINSSYGPWGVAELVQELQPSIANGSVGGIEDLCKHLRFAARWFHVVNPCREIHSSAESLQKCVAAAQKAQKEWSSLPPHGRTLRLLDVAYNLERSSESFVKLMKCASKQEEETAMLFAPYCANAVKALAVQTGNLSGVMQEPSAAASATTVLQTSNPIGVVAVACPEVLSITALVKMVAIAVTAGNAVILISSPVRSDAENIVKVFVDSALPRGLVNVVYGCRADVAAHLVAGGVRALWYFGSDQEWARVAAGCDPLRLQCLWRDSELNIDENGVLSNQRCDVFWRCTVAKRVCVPEGDIFAN